MNKTWPLIASLLATGCSAADSGSTSGSPDEESQFLTTTILGQSVITGDGFGKPLSGISADQRTRFTAGRTAFITPEDAADGLGPVFNDTACGNCHTAGAIGGASALVETRFGKTTNGAFDPMASSGGSLIQVHGIGTITANGHTCTYNGEVVPSQATIVAGRVTTPLFGLGLIDAVPDSTFQSLAQVEASRFASTAGVVNMVDNLVTGKKSVGKFGWKAQVPSVQQFSGDAYVNEMGITSTLFPAENCPQGNCELLLCDPVKDPEDTDNDVAAFADFMRFLGPPPIGAITNDVKAGATTFVQIGCANCHVPALQTGSSSDPAFNKITFAPFSDFLIHDMGTLGDGIVQGQANGHQMRTAPLWGVSARPKLLHDGRASNLNDAIRAHAGQGQAARNSYVALSASSQAQLIALLKAM